MLYSRDYYTVGVNNDALVHAKHIAKFVNVVHPRLIDSLLDDATCVVVVNRIEVGAVR